MICARGGGASLSSAQALNGSCSTTNGFTAGGVPFGLRSWLDVQTYTGARTEVGCEAWGSGCFLAPPARPAAATQRSYLRATARFVGCARNVGAAIEGGRAAHIEALGGAFAKYSVLLWEDGSTDTSREMLRAWAARNPRVRVLAPYLGTRWVGASLGRVPRLAFCRNILLAEYLKEVPQSGDDALLSPFYVALDLDCQGSVLRPPMLVAAVRQHMLASPGATAGAFDVLSANSQQSYYDLWVLRSRTLSLEYDCWHDKELIERHGKCSDYNIAIDPAAPTFAVESAFNGLAIYSGSALLRAGCRYHGPLLLTAEHVGFHACLRSRGVRIAIAPSLVQECGREHTGAHDERRARAQTTVVMLSNGTVRVTSAATRAAVAAGPSGRRAPSPLLAGLRGGLLECVVPDGTLARVWWLLLGASLMVLMVLRWRRKGAAASGRGAAESAELLHVARGHAVSAARYSS